MKQIIIISLLLLTVVNINGQATWRDTLMVRLEKDKLTLDERIGAYHLITQTYASNDLKNTYIYGMKGLELAKKANDKRMIATFCRYVGSTYTYTASYDTAHMYQQIQVDIAEEIGERDLLQLTYFGFGNLYARQGKFLLAVENYQKSMTFYDDIPFEAIDIYTLLANLKKTYGYYSQQRTYLLCLGNTGECYRRLNNLERALFYLTKAKDMIDTPGIYSDNGVVAQVYRELGYVYFAKGDIDKALEYQLKILNEYGPFNQVMESDCREALIKIYIIKKEYDKALTYAYECLEFAKSLGDPYIDVLAWNSFAEIYRAQGLYKECEAAATKAWNIDSTSVDTAPISAINIAYANSFLGNMEKAEYFFKKNEELVKEKNNKNFQESMAEMEVKYETEKKEIKIASLEKERQLYIWLGIAGILLAVASAIVLLQKLKNTRKEKQLIATRSVMDGERGERTRLARDLHDRLSSNLAAVKIGIKNSEKLLQNVDERLDSCIEEVRRIAHNLMPVSLQYGMRAALEDFATQFPNVYFHFFGEERRIEERIEFVMYCCANELVNNSFQHSGSETINLQLIQDEKHITLTVQDNGCGFNEKTVVKGLGLKNIYDRAASCNGKIDIITAPGEGTETTIVIKTGNKRTWLPCKS